MIVKGEDKDRFFTPSLPFLFLFIIFSFPPPDRIAGRKIPVENCKFINFPVRYRVTLVLTRSVIRNVLDNFRKRVASNYSRLARIIIAFRFFLPFPSLFFFWRREERLLRVGRNESFVGEGEVAYFVISTPTYEYIGLVVPDDIASLSLYILFVTFYVTNIANGLVNTMISARSSTVNAPSEI